MDENEKRILEKLTKTEEKLKKIKEKYNLEYIEIKNKTKNKELENSKKR